MKGKVVPVHAMKAQGGIRCTASLIFNDSTSCRELQTFHPSHFMPKKVRGTRWVWGWV